MQTLYRLILELLLEYRDSVTTTMVADVACQVEMALGDDVYDIKSDVVLNAQATEIVQDYLGDIAYGRNDMSIMDRHEAALTTQAYDDLIVDLKVKKARDAYGSFLFDLDEVPFYDRKEFVEKLAEFEARFNSPRDYVAALASKRVADFVFSSQREKECPDLVKQIKHRRIAGTMLLAEYHDTSKLSNDESRDDLLTKELYTNVKRPFDSRGQTNNYDGLVNLGMGDEHQINPPIPISYLRRRVPGRFPAASTKERHVNALGRVVWLDRTHNVVKQGLRDSRGRFLPKEVKTVTRLTDTRQVVENSFTGKPMLDIKFSLEMPAKKYWHYQEAIDLLKAPLDRRYKDLKANKDGLGKEELNEAWAEHMEAFRVFVAKAKVIKNAVKSFVRHARRGELELAMNHKYPVWFMKVDETALTKPFYLFVSAYPEKNEDGSDYRFCRVTEFLSSNK